MFCPQCGSGKLRKERLPSVLVSYYRCGKCYCRCRYESFGAVRRLIAIAEGEMIVKRKMTGLKRVVPAGILLTVLVFGFQPWKVFAQADAGYTKVGTSATLQFIDLTVQNGHNYQYEVTAFSGPLESTATSDGIAVIPGSGTHSVTVRWGASTTPGAAYNIYRLEVFAPNPPGVVSLTVN